MSEDGHKETFLGPRGIEQATYTLVGWQKAALVLLILTIPTAALLGKFQVFMFTINAILAVFFFITTVY